MKLVAALVLVSSPALADVTARVSAGTGGDTSSPTGFAAVDAAARAAVEAEPTPIDRRGLYLGNQDGGIWVFTGVDPRDRDGAGVDVSGLAHAGFGDAANTAMFAGRAWARGAGWQLTGRVAYQPIGDLAETFSRSGRGVLATGGAIEIPPMWALGTTRYQFSTGAWTIDLGHRSTLVDGAWTRSGWDRDVDFHGMRWQAPSYAIELARVHYIEFGAETATTAEAAYGTSATRIDVDIARTEIALSAALELRLHAGIGMAMPYAMYKVVGTSESSYGPVATAPIYGVELREAIDRDRSIAVGVGSWLRLDPSGQAGDAGQLATAALDWRLARVLLHGQLEGGRLVRAAVSDGAPMGIAPVGTTMWMGRGSGAATVELAHGATLTAAAWIERSDRDDPRWSVPADGSIATHVGAELSLGMQYR